MNEITVPRPIMWMSAAETHKGMVRAVNEDAVLAQPDSGLWAVADGLGGHAVGDLASQMVVDALALSENKQALSEMVDGVESSLKEANKQIRYYADTELNRATMGSTVVSLLIRGRVGVCLWVGDSRLYRFRNNELVQLSTDHSQVQEWVEQGILQESEAENHPQSNVITRAIGVENEVQIDVNVFDTQIGDTYLLCSDGLHNTIDKHDILKCLSLQKPQECAEHLMKMALENGAPDNVSVVVVRGEAGRFDVDHKHGQQNRRMD